MSTPRLKPVGRPPEPPAPPREFDVHAAIGLLAALDAAGAIVRISGEVVTSQTPLRLDVEAARAAGAVWGQCLELVSALHEARRWQRHRGVPDSIVRDAALVRVNAVAALIGEPAAEQLAMWLDRRWESARPCPFEWCRLRDGRHESFGRLPLA